MYKVLIVDDEKIMRLAIKTIIKWEENGFQLVGEAKDGVAALSMVEEYKPDILITDLKMPNMDGITLIKKLKEQNYPGKILVLSNYGDFELVRDAMKWGASDYLLKVTMKANELIEILKEAAEKIESERSQDQRNSLILNENIGVLKSKLLKQILEDEADITYLEKECGTLGISMQKQKNVLLYVFVDQMENAVRTGKVRDKKICSTSIVNIILELLSNINGGEIIELSYKEFVVVIPVEHYAGNAADLYKLVKNISKTVSMYINLTISIVISDEFYGLNVREAFQTCKSAINLKFYTGDSSIINMRDAALLSNNISNYDYTKIIPDIKLNMESGELNDIIEIFKGLINKAVAEKSNPNDLKTLIYVIINSLSGLLMEFGMDNKEYFDKHKFKLNSIETVNEYYNTLEELLTEMYNKLRGLKACAYRKEVNIIIDYIKQNISSKLTLKMIAKCANMNESYVCRMFKNEVGTSIFNYMNEVRIKKAQELLKESGSVVKDVAIAVGIDDQLYFNRVFKKYAGVSPTQYKSNVCGKIF